MVTQIIVDHKALVFTATATFTTMVVAFASQIFALPRVIYAELYFSYLHFALVCSSGR